MGLWGEAWEGGWRLYSRQKEGRRTAIYKGPGVRGGLHLGKTDVCIRLVWLELREKGHEVIKC